MTSSLKQSGQILVGALILLLLIAILIPALVRYSQNETQWTMKEQHATSAFDLAETAVERGYTQLILSTTSWQNAVTGNNIPTGYKFDQAYTDIVRGSYEVRIASAGGKVAITGIGRDATNHEIRTIKAIYANPLTSQNTAVNSGTHVDMSGSAPNVEWGSIVSHNDIQMNNFTYPRYYSAGAMVPVDSSPAPPNSDAYGQWFSYVSNLPPYPQLDLPYYKSLAQGYGVSPPAGCPASYYSAGGFFFRGCTDNSGRTYYSDSGTTSFNGGSSGIFIKGNVITLGDIGTGSDGGSTSAAGNNYSVPIPGIAWQEYPVPSAWTHYQCMDGGAPATYAAAVSSNYQPSGNYSFPGACFPSSGHVVLHGLVYAGAGIVTGGNGIWIGALITPGQAKMNGSGFTFVADPSVAAAAHYTTPATIQRVSWQEVVGCDWSNTNPTCPP